MADSTAGQLTSAADARIGPQGPTPQFSSHGSRLPLHNVYLLGDCTWAQAGAQLRSTRFEQKFRKSQLARRDHSHTQTNKTIIGNAVLQCYVCACLDSCDCAVSRVERLQCGGLRRTYRYRACLPCMLGASERPTALCTALHVCSFHTCAPSGIMAGDLSRLRDADEQFALVRARLAAAGPIVASHPNTNLLPQVAYNAIYTAKSTMRTWRDISKGGELG